MKVKPPYEGDQVGAHIRVAPDKVPLTELEAGSIFAWPAGALGVADWRYKHLAGFTSPATGSGGQNDAGGGRV